LVLSRIVDQHPVVDVVCAGAPVLMHGPAMPFCGMITAGTEIVGEGAASAVGIEE
jgi:hypothetical protein